MVMYGGVWCCIGVYRGIWCCIGCMVMYRWCMVMYGVYGVV